MDGEARSLPRYLLLAAFGGIYVGVAVVLLTSVSAPLHAAGAPTTRLVQAAVFGIALRGLLAFIAPGSSTRWRT